MKAIVFESVGRVALAERPEPRLVDPRDALVRVTTAGVCGSDLHIVDGRDEGVRSGTIMGHELVGIVEEVGSAVTGLVRGDRVVSPFSVSCGECFFCARGLTARCASAQCLGVVLEDGSGLEGAQAELVRVPLASSSLVALPPRDVLADEDAVLLGDVLSTAFSNAERALIERRAVVAVDGVESRRARAGDLGAFALPPDAAAVRAALDERTEGRGADAVLECVGSPSALDLAIALARNGAAIAVAGYHTEAAYPLPMPQAYAKNLSFRFGRASARDWMEKLLPLVVDGSLSPSAIVTHRLPLAEGVRAYDVFRSRTEGAIKVLLKP